MIYPTQEDIIYLAGIVDGEGSIGIHAGKPYGRMRASNHLLRLGVSNTSESLIRWMEARFGGASHIQHGNIHTVRPCWNWVLHGQAAVDMLRRIRPYLIVKSAQAWLALEFWAQRTPDRGHRTSQDELALREGFRLAIQTANSGGAV